MNLFIYCAILGIIGFFIFGWAGIMLGIILGAVLSISIRITDILGRLETIDKKLDQLSKDRSE